MKWHNIYTQIPYFQAAKKSANKPRQYTPKRSRSNIGNLEPSNSFTQSSTSNKKSNKNQQKQIGNFMMNTWGKAQKMQFEAQKLIIQMKFLCEQVRIELKKMMSEFKIMKHKFIEQFQEQLKQINPLFKPYQIKIQQTTPIITLQNTKPKQEHKHYRSYSAQNIKYSSKQNVIDSNKFDHNIQPQIQDYYIQSTEMKKQVYYDSCSQRKQQSHHDKSFNTKRSHKITNSFHEMSLRLNEMKKMLNQ